MRASAVLLPLLAALPLAAQRAEGDRLLAGGDTTAAIAAYERERDDPEALYRAGRLLLTRHVAGLVRSDPLDRARALFQRATELAPDSAAYWLGLAESYRAEGDLGSRVQVNRLVDRAWELARRHGSSVSADVAFRAGRVRWERYERLAHRYLFNNDARTLAPEVLLGEWDELQDFFARQVRPDPGDPGAAERAAAEERFRAALAADATHVPAAGMLVVAYLEDGRLEPADELTRQLVRAAPDDGEAQALRGLVLVRLGRWREAARAFERAMAHLPPEAADPYASLRPLLRPRDDARWQRMSPEERDQLRHLYWEAAEPLLLDSLNEARLEYLTRVAYVEHRWSDPLRNRPGRETERGRVYLRYGPPDVWASFGTGRVSEQAPEGGIDPAAGLETQRIPVVWLYHTSELRFVFSVTPGFGSDQFGGDFRDVYNRARDIFPVRFDNVPVVATMDTALAQFAQFRGDRPGTTDLAVFAFLPIGRMAQGLGADSVPLTTAAILRNQFMVDVHRAVREERIATHSPTQVEYRAWRFNLPAASYLLRVEAMLGAVDRAARSTSVLSLRAYDGDTLQMSDMLVADAVAPRDSAFQSWRDFFIRPSVGRIAPADPIALLWEVYGLTPDSTGSVRYTVDLVLTVREVERRGFAARILGGIADAVGLSARGDDAVALQYERSAAAPANGRQPDYLTVALDDAPEGLYTVTVTVTDLVSGAATTGRRAIQVTGDAARR